MGRDTTFYCSTGLCTWYYGGPSGSDSISPGTLSGVSSVYDTLTIEDVVADHEGVYCCEYNGGQDIFNLTVVGKQVFAMCLFSLLCSYFIYYTAVLTFVDWTLQPRGITLHFSEGLDIIHLRMYLKNLFL